MEATNEHGTNAPANVEVPDPVRSAGRAKESVETRHLKSTRTVERNQQRHHGRESSANPETDRRCARATHLTEMVEASKWTLRERTKQRTVGQIVDGSVRQIMEELVELILCKWFVQVVLFQADSHLFHGTLANYRDSC